MGYKVGDKVRIREDLKEGSGYHEIEIVSEYILQYAGQYAMIMADCKDGTYKLDRDKGEWYWPEKALLSVVQNNADKIRQMSDEELAKFLTEQFCHGVGERLILEWLQKPAE